MSPRSVCPACAETAGTIHALPTFTADGGLISQLIECGVCGTLRLDNPPPPHVAYPLGYYAHRGACADHTACLPAFLGGMAPEIFVGAAARFYGTEERDARAEVVRAALRKALIHYLGGLDTDAKILDVGAGTGDLVHWLREIGYRSAIGIDPLISADIEGRGGPLVLKAELTDLGCGADYDLIVFNHALEHMAAPVAGLSAARDRLAHDGRILLRIPLAGCFAWRTLKLNWLQLDLPRHLFLPSAQGMALLSEASGLAVMSCVHDSGLLQFGPIEEVAEDPESIGQRLTLAAMLNATGDGDQASFLLTHAGST